MKTVIISPYSQRLAGNKVNPKNYPYWTEVIEHLRKQGIRTIQIGTLGETPLGTDEILYNQSLRQLEKITAEVDTWAAVDNFFPHLCNFVNKRGVVVFGQSDPRIFGYENNINLLKDRTFLRTSQFATWPEAEYREDVWVTVETVVDAITSLIKD